MSLQKEGPKRGSQNKVTKHIYGITSSWSKVSRYSDNGHFGLKNGVQWYSKVKLWETLLSQELKINK